MSWPKPTQGPGLRPAEGQILGHQGLLVLLVGLGVLRSLIFQQRHQSISLLHHLQHLFEDQALLQQVLLVLEAVCRAQQNKEKVEQKHRSVFGPTAHSLKFVLPKGSLGSSYHLPSSGF